MKKYEHIALRPEVKKYLDAIQDQLNQNGRGVRYSASYLVEEALKFYDVEYLHKQ